MNRTRSYFIVVSAVLCMVTAAAAIEYQHLTEEEGVEVAASHDPLGPNNQIVAYVKFVNRNSYKVDVNWTPVMDCGGGRIVHGATSAFSLDAKSTFQVTLWRTMACGHRHMEKLSVEMTVERSAGF